MSSSSQHERSTKALENQGPDGKRLQYTGRGRFYTDVEVLLNLFGIGQYFTRGGHQWPRGEPFSYPEDWRIAFTELSTHSRGSRMTAQFGMATSGYDDDGDDNDDTGTRSALHVSASTAATVASSRSAMSAILGAAWLLYG